MKKSELEPLIAAARRMFPQAQKPASVVHFVVAPSEDSFRHYQGKHPDVRCVHLARRQDFIALTFDGKSRVLVKLPYWWLNKGPAFEQELAHRETRQ